MSLPQPLLERLTAAGYLNPQVPFEAEPLQGGFWNQVFRLRTSEFDWVIKRYSTGGGNKMFPILPGHEAQALQEMGRYGISPTLVKLLPDRGNGAVLIYNYVDGNMWKGDYFSAGRLLARSHGIPVRGQYRTRPTSPEDILKHTDQIFLDVPKSPEKEALRSHEPEIPSRPIVPLRTNALVHTDCGPGNIVMGPQGPVLIDWQCPGLGDPAEDLACFLSGAIQILYGFHPLSPEQEAEFLRGYGAQATIEHARRMAPFYFYRIAAYALYRKLSTRESEPAVSARYSVALEAAIAQLSAA